MNTITATLNLKKIDKLNPSVAKTILARDYKGFGTGFNTTNGVIELSNRMEPVKLGNIFNYTGGNFAGNVYDKFSPAPALNTMRGGDTQPMISETGKDRCIRIRKLTPKECYRLMGFDDESFERADKVNSNSQLYKQAGNSIVVDVLMAIFDNLLIHGRSAWLDELLKDEEDQL